MNATASAATAVSTLVSLALVMLLWSMYRGYRLDRFRSEMFSIRDRLFDYAGDGHIPYHHPAYGLARTTMNGFIRFGDRVALFGVLLTQVRYAAQLQAAPDSFSAQFEAATESLTQQQREALEGFVQEMHATVLEQLVFTSPVALSILGVMSLVQAVRGVQRLATRTLVSTLGSATRKWEDGLDSIALSLGGGVQFA